MATIRVEAENTTLTNYIQQREKDFASNNAFIRLLGTEGTASFDFTGDAGAYDIVIGYYDENDGQAQLSVTKGNNLLDEWILDQGLGSKKPNANTFVTRQVATGLNLATGDSFSITGTLDQGELAAIDYIEFIPVQNNTAPTTTGVTDISVVQGSVESVIDLWSAFNDAEDADNQLTYSVENNSNAALFDAVSIDAATGELTLDYNAAAIGTGEITVRATDTEGLFVDTSFNVEVTNTAPTTTGITDVSVVQGSVESVIDLFGAFNDAEDADNQLTYSVENNSNAALFDTVSINPGTGQLTLDYNDTASGSALILVRATDTGGLFVDTSFNVEVTNTAPTTTGITDFAVPKNSVDTVINLRDSFADAEDADNQLTFSVDTDNTDLLVPTINPATGELTLDYSGKETGTANLTVTATDTGGLSTQTSFNVDVFGSLRIEAEDYQEGGEGVGYSDSGTNNFWGAYRPDDGVDIQDTSDVGGGYNIGRVVPGEWLEYDVTVPATGTYDIVARVASAVEDNHQLQYSLDGQQGTFEFGNTGGWQAWEDVILSDVPLNAGEDVLRLDIIAVPFKLNYIELIPVGNIAENTAPTITEIIDDITVNAGADNTEINLFDVFEDEESFDNELTYEITSNSNSDLVGTNIVNGQLTVGYPVTSGGTAEIAVTATDPEGLSTETTFTVNIIGPMRIEAEDYQEGGEGVGYSDSDTNNFWGAYRPDDGVDIQDTADLGGGYNIGRVLPGEWLEYDVTVPATGTYDIVARVASAVEDNHQLQYSLVDGQKGTFEFGNTGGWQAWEDVILSDVPLNAGEDVLRLDIIAGAFKLNYIELIPVNIPDETLADPVSYAAASQGVYVDLSQEVGFVPDNPMNEPLTMMALGDSITEGVDGVTPEAERGGYRTYLWQALDGLGLEVDFVGSKQNGPAELGDRDNQGHPGWRLGNLRLGRTTGEFTEETTGVDQWLPQFQPDIIMLMGGTNDASGNDDNSSSMLTQLELLLDDIEDITTEPSYNGGEGAEVFLATIPPMDPARQGEQRPISAQNYNQLIREQIPSNYDLTLVDVESALTVNDLAGSGDNGLHPSDQGYQKIANKWLEGILDNYGTQNDLEGVTEVTGSSLDDVITGSSADNRIEGGEGNDELTGSGGADTFVYSNPSAGIDTITDFNPAEGDLFEISASSFGGGLTPGALAANQFVLGTEAADTDDRFVYDTATGNLFFDVDGNGNTAATLLAILDGNLTLGEAQFTIV